MNELILSNLESCRRNFAALQQEVAQAEMALQKKRADLIATGGAIQVLESLAKCIKPDVLPAAAEATEPKS